jgi:hypothetical protein
MAIGREFGARRAIFHWQEIAGKEIAANSAPLKLEYGVLWLGVKSSVWSHHLMMMKREIINRFNLFTGEISVKDIRFLTGNFAKMSLDEKEENQVFDLAGIMISENDAKKLKKAYEAAENQDVAKKGAQLFKKSLALSEYKKRLGFAPCRACGVMCENGLCTACERKRRQDHIAAVRRFLNELPWFTYAELNRQIPCTSREYIAAKTELMQHYSERLPRSEKDAAADNNLIMLAMLALNISYDKLRDDLILKIYKRFRRRF